MSNVRGTAPSARRNPFHYRHAEKTKMRHLVGLFREKEQELLREQAEIGMPTSIIPQETVGETLANILGPPSSFFKSIQYKIPDLKTLLKVLDAAARKAGVPSAQVAWIAKMYLPVWKDVIARDRLGRRGIYNLILD